jgi:hypothetical protein
VTRAAELQIQTAEEPAVHRLPGRRMARRSVASAGAFATALTAVLAGSVGMAAAAPAPHVAKGSAGTGTAGATTASAPAKAAKSGQSATAGSTGSAPAATSSPAATPAARTAPSPAASATSTPAAGGKSGKAGTTAAPAAATRASATKGSACDSSGSGEAELANASPAPTYNQGVLDSSASALDAASSHALSFTYFDEAGFVATIWNPATSAPVLIPGAPTTTNKALGTVSEGIGSVTGPFPSAPGASQYSVGAPLVGHFSVTPATSAGTKSGVPVSGTVPALATAIHQASPAPGYYAISITLADDDDRTPAPCSMQWVEHVAAPAPPPRPTPPTPTPPPPVVPPNVTPPPTVQITKLNNAAGTGFGASETAAAGSTSVPYRVTVTNPNASPGTLTVLTDTIDGVTINICPSLIGTVLAPFGQADDSVTCNFTGPVPSTPTVDTAGTTLSVNGVLVSATAQSTVFPPVLGVQIPAPPTPPAAGAPAAAPATLAFTGAPVGKMLAVALGMIAVGLALLGALQLAREERRPWSGLGLALVARTQGPTPSAHPGWSSGHDDGSSAHQTAGNPPPGGRGWLVGYLQGGWTRLRGPDRGPGHGHRPPPPSRRTGFGGRPGS